MDLNFEINTDFDFNFEKLKSKQEPPEKRSHRRKSECIELSEKYLYRRAFSELNLINLDLKIESGKSFALLTGGNVDALSFLHLILRDVKKLDYLLVSTWCAGAEDCLWLVNACKNGVIGKMDFFAGEIFTGQYKIETGILKDFYESKDNKGGRFAVFKNHSKIFAGYNLEKNFYFGVSTSANINTNPRTENAFIICNKEIFDFYYNYFSGINSFE